MQRFSLKHLQKLESNKSLVIKSKSSSANANNDYNSNNSNNSNKNSQQMQLKQAEKDYYELFAALSRREQGRGYQRSVIQQQPSSQQQQLSAESPSSLSLVSPVDPVAAGSASNVVPKLHKQANIIEKKIDRLGAEEKVGNVQSSEEAADGNNSRSVGRRLDFSLEHKGPNTAAANRGRELSPNLGKPLRSSIKFDKKENISTDNTINVDKTTNNSNNNSSNNFRRISSAHSLGFKNFGLKDIDGIASPSQATLLSMMKPLPTVLHCQDTILQKWALDALNHMHVHKSLSVSMDRKPEVVHDYKAFCERVEDESHRSYEHVHAVAGVLEVTPMQALHLPESKTPMLVRVSYGDQVII